MSESAGHAGCAFVCPPHLRKMESVSRVRLFVTLWTEARQAPLSMGYSRREYWVGLPALQRILPTQGSNPGLLHLQAGFLSSEPQPPIPKTFSRMRPTKFPEIPVSLERNTEVFRHPLL